MYNPSRIILATCIRGVFSYKNISSDDIINIFPIDTLVYFTYFGLRVSMYPGERSYSQRHIEGNEEVKLKFYNIC